jgi:hypothetical protein
MVVDVGMEMGRKKPHFPKSDPSLLLSPIKSDQPDIAAAVNPKSVRIHT